MHKEAKLPPFLSLNYQIIYYKCVVPYVKMEKAEPCAPGMHLTRDECEEAAKVAAYMGITLLDSKPEGRLNMDVPSYCSYQAGGHQKFLYNTETHENTFSSKSFLSGEFKSICRSKLQTTRK